MFTPCADCENDKTMFRWKKVACSRKCAMKYFAKIEESRKTPSAEMENKEMNKVSHSDTISESKKITRKKNNEESEQIE